MNILQPIAIIVGVVSGVSGFVLGVLNYIHQQNTTRPQIVVRPRVYYANRAATGRTIAENLVVLEICNKGLLPVTGSTIGFLPKPGVIGFLFRCPIIKLVVRHGKIGVFMKSLHKRWQGGVTIFPEPKPVGGRTWMSKLEPQERAIMQIGLPDTDKPGRAFATTIVGETFKASRRDMWIFAKQLKESKLSSPRPATPCT